MRGGWCSQKIKDPKEEGKKSSALGRHKVKDRISQWLKKRARDREGKGERKRERILCV